MPNSTITLAPNENYIPTGLPGGFFIYNAQGNEEIYFAEQNVIELFGCKTIKELREYTHNSFKGMVHPDDLEKIENDIQAQTFTSEKRHDYVRYRILTKQGDVRYIEDFGHLLHGEGGQKFFYVYIVDVDRDEFYNRESNSFAETQALTELKNVDRLTGLLNMEAFYEAAQGVIEGGIGPDAACKGQPIFIHFDIANFKLINEQCGRARGDALLCRMAHTLREEFGDGVVARFSNDHFAVLTCAEDAPQRVERVHASMANALPGAHVEVKAGLYKLEDTCREAAIACDHARLACNTVKRRYDRVYGTYDASLYERLQLQQYVVDAIDEAVEREYLKVYYQPVVRVETGKICGYEALARWIDPTRGFLPPSQFIAPLEEYRLIHKVDSFVARRVCADLRALLNAGAPAVPVSVNLSRLDFELCDIFSEVVQACIDYNVPHDLLDIEITESALNDDTAQLKAEVKRFREAGFHIWIDDFGSGYSSFTNLLDYEFDVLKLDLEFMRTYDEHPQAADLIKSIAQSARDLGAQPLQEGVETQTHFDFLRTIGVDRAQGYFFGRPMPLEESREATRARGLEWE